MPIHRQRRHRSATVSITVTTTALTGAEILTEMTYPTGGKTVFEYEPHTYSKTATVYPISLNQETIDKMAGGLRVKSITDYPGGGKQEKRTFSYNNPSTAHRPRKSLGYRTPLEYCKQLFNFDF